MANLAEMTGLSREDVTALTLYINEVNAAHKSTWDAIIEIAGFSKNPKAVRPKFSENQEKALLIQIGMWWERQNREEKP